MSTATEGSGTASAAPGPLIAGGLILAAGIALLGVAISVAARDGVTPGGPTLAPIIVTGLWVLAAAGYLLEQLRNRTARTETISWRTPALMLVAVIAYAAVLKYTVVGYVLATALFVVAGARLLSTKPWRAAIVRDVLAAVGLSLGIYLAFTRLLGIVLPAGVLPL